MWLVLQTGLKINSALLSISSSSDDTSSSLMIKKKKISGVIFYAYQICIVSSLHVGMGARTKFWRICLGISSCTMTLPNVSLLAALNILVWIVEQRCTHFSVFATLSHYLFSSAARWWVSSHLPWLWFSCY